MTDYSLYIVPTPIGNRADITQRALDVLGEVAWVAAEDTRTTGALLQSYGIKAKFISLHEHNEVQRAEKICALLGQGESVALVSDAGTPLISDPGAKLVTAVVAAGHKVVPLPGACAAICALSAAGLDTTSFIFKGFLANKSAARQKELSQLKEKKYTIILYEAARRLIDCVKDIVAVIGSERQLVLARELTKLHEEIVRSSAGELLAQLQSGEIVLKGECVLMLEGASKNNAIYKAQLTSMLQTVLPHTSMKSAVQIVVELSGAKKSEVYALALELSKKN